jgi:hypothetical protein
MGQDRADSQLLLEKRVVTDMVFVVVGVYDDIDPGARERCFDLPRRLGRAGVDQQPVEVVNAGVNRPDDIVQQDLVLIYLPVGPLLDGDTAPDACRITAKFGTGTYFSLSPAGGALQAPFFPRPAVYLICTKILAAR